MEWFPIESAPKTGEKIVVVWLAILWWLTAMALALLSSAHAHNKV